MKSFRKLLAVVLSLLMVASVVVLPASAAEEAPTDTTVTREVSIFDLSNAVVGATAGGETTSLPAGLSEAGITRFTQGIYLTSYSKGTQEIVEVDGEKALKVNFDVAQNQGEGISDGSGSKGIFGIQMDVPAKYIPYVTSISADIIGNTAGKNLVYRVAVTDGASVGTTDVKAQGIEAQNNADITITRNTADMKYFSGNNWYSAFNRGAGSGTWVENNAQTKKVVLIMNDNGATVDGGTGYAIIKDIKITAVGPEEVLDAVTKTFSIFDLSESYVGATTEGDDTSLPDGVNGITRWAFGQESTYYKGKQEIVEVDGEKALKVNFNVAGKQGGWIWGSKGVYAIKIAVPTKYVPYITGISADIENAAANSLAYRFGVTNGTKYGIKSGNGVSTAAKGDTTLSYDTSVMLTKGGAGAALGSADNVTEGYWSDLGLDVTQLFFIMTDQDSVDGGTGYAIIKDITVDVTTTPKNFAAMPITKKFDMMDLSDAELGEMAASDYPFGVSESGAFTSNGGVKTIVENTKGKKVIQLDLGSVTFKRGTSETDKINQGGYSPIYKLSLNDIPSQYVKYIDKIKIKFKKSADSQAYLIYNFGVTNGSDYSKNGTGSNTTVKAETTGEILTEYTPTELNKVSSWDAGAYGGSATKWDASYTGLFLWFSAYVAEGATAGTITIEEISYTASATEEQWAEADAELEANKAYINDFEVSGTEVTTGAVSGTKVLNASGGAYGGAAVYLNTNRNLKTATGVSFWAYNPADADQSVKIWINTSTGVRYMVSNAMSFASKTFKKVNIDFSKVYVYKYKDDGVSYDDGGYTAGEATSIPKADIRKITHITIYRRGTVQLYVDDVYLNFADNAVDSGVNATADNVKIAGKLNLEDAVAAELTEDGKIKIPASASGQYVVIDVPAGTFTQASSFVYNLQSYASTDVRLMFFTNTQKDYPDDADDTDYIKNGRNLWNYTLKANEPGAHEFDYYGTGESYTSVLEGGYYFDVNIPTDKESSYYYYASTTPTASERYNITKIYLGVEAFGTEGEYITLDPNFPITEEGIRITGKVKGEEGGTVSVFDNIVFSGEQGEVLFTPEDGYYLKSVTAVDNFNNEIAIAPLASSSDINLGLYYVFTVPEARDVIVTAEFATIEASVSQNIDCDLGNNSLNFEFTVPFVEGKAYDGETGVYAEALNYGIILVANEAFEKYGYDAMTAQEDVPSNPLTYEKVMELKETGHHLANYIYVLDKNTAIKAEDNQDVAKFFVEMTNVSAEARRKLFTVLTFAEFADENAETTHYSYNGLDKENTIDKWVFGRFYKDQLEMEKGINYQSDLEADISVWEDIYNQGFDHIRLPINVSSRLDENSVVSEEYLEKVDIAIKNALRVGFSLVIDLHGSVAVGQDFATNSPKLIKIWNQLAERYAELPYSVAFQIINEPGVDEVGVTDSMSYEELMALQETVAKNIRAINGNTNRTIVIGADTNGYWANGEFTESLLGLGNLIIDYHYYHPMKFTHSGAEWTDSKYEAGETEYEVQSMVNVTTSVVEFCAQYDNVTPWFGEWGAYRPDATAKVNYYRDFVNAATDAGVAWSLWEYGSGWSPYTKEKGWDTELLNAMGLG